MLTEKSRTYAFVQKLENLPDDWWKQLEELKMPCCYIVHDKDEAEPHVHGMVDFNSPVRSPTVLQTVPESFGVKFVEPVRNRTAYQRYMLHIGMADKHEYMQDELILLFGCKCNFSEVYNVGFENVYDLIERENILNFGALVTLCMQKYPEYVRYIANHTTFVRSFVTERARMM